MLDILFCIEKVDYYVKALTPNPLLEILFHFLISFSFPTHKTYHKLKMSKKCLSVNPSWLFIRHESLSFEWSPNQLVSHEWG